ncbi:MAG: DUF4254 domain-containing protein [Calditrichaeota bacterium]|nr:MAG: DUF4254 domain-containing protein [Calditrichota bacterium]
MHSLSEVLSPFRGERLIEWFSDLTELWHDTAPIKPKDISSPHGLTQWMHYKNYEIWHLKDKMRRPDTPNEEVVECERLVDHYNRNRMKAIEQLDIWIENVLMNANIRPGHEIEVNSETPGSIIDRLSIVVLKIFHLQEHDNNSVSDSELKKQIELRLKILEEQKTDLAYALDKLLLDLRQAKKRHKVYRQFKIYNDPSFHPEEYNHK